MKAKTITLGILRALGIIVAILLFCLFVYKIQSVIVYIAIAAVISLIGRPIVWFLKKRLKIPIKLAVIIVLLMVTAIFIGIIALFVPIIVQQSENLGQIDFDAFKTDLNELNIQVREYLGVEQIDIIQGLRQTSFVRNFDLEVIPNYIK